MASWSDRDGARGAGSAPAATPTPHPPSLGFASARAPSPTRGEGKRDRLAARPRHEPRRRLGAEPTRPIIQLCAGDVDLHRAPRAAVDDFLANREPPPEEAGEPGRRGGGRESCRVRAHRLMLEKE